MERPLGPNMVLLDPKRALSGQHKDLTKGPLRPKSGLLRPTKGSEGTAKGLVELHSVLYAVGADTEEGIRRQKDDPLKLQRDILGQK